MILDFAYSLRSVVLVILHFVYFVSFSFSQETGNRLLKSNYHVDDPYMDIPVSDDGSKETNIPRVFVSPVTLKVYSLVFNDEFNGEEINQERWTYRKDTHKAKTRTIEFNGREIDILVKDDASTLKDGELRLDVRWDHKKESILTGGINTMNKFLPRYGYYETKVSFRDCKGQGYWPAFWIHFMDSTKYTTGTEIDVFEFLPGTKEIFQTLHWYKKDEEMLTRQSVQHFDTTNIQQQKENEHFSSTKHFKLDNWDTVPHVFAVEWTPDQLIFYTNGKVTRKVDKSGDPREVPSAYQMIYFSCSAGTWGGHIAQGGNPLPFYVYFDYCRVYQEDEQDAYYRFGEEMRLIKTKERKGMF